MKRYCLALDLVDDDTLIKEYEAYHEKVWPEILDSIKDSGIVQMEIYRLANRLFMIMEVDDSFSFESKAKADAENPRGQVREKFAGLIEATGRVIFWLTTDEAVAVHPFAPVTVTVYILGELTVFVAVIIPPPQL